MKPFLSTMLVVLTALNFGCGSKKETEKKNTDNTAPPSSNAASSVADTSAVPAAKAAPQAVFEGPGSHLAKTVEDWSIKGVPRYFGPDNLYDLINGGSEVYVAYGLKKMVTADYVSAKREDASVTVEIYDMGSPLGAFGRFSRFLDGKADPSKVGEGLPAEIAEQGMLGDANAALWKGDFLVNLTVMDESATATMESTKAIGQSALPAFAKAIFEKIPAGAPLPKEVGCFPGEALMKRSQVYTPSALMGETAFGGGYSARYADGDSRWTLFVTNPITETSSIDATLKSVIEKSGPAEKLVLRKSADRIWGFKSAAQGKAPAAMKSLASLMKACAE